MPVYQKHYSLFVYFNTGLPNDTTMYHLNSNYDEFIGFNTIDLR